MDVSNHGPNKVSKRPCTCESVPVDRDIDDGLGLRLRVERKSTVESFVFHLPILLYHLLSGLGVLLLNASLTVRAHEPGSHFGKGWEASHTRIP